MKLRLYLFLFLSCFSVTANVFANPQEVLRVLTVIHGPKVWQTNTSDGRIMFIAPLIGNDLNAYKHTNAELILQYGKNNLKNYEDINKDPLNFFGTYAVSLYVENKVVNEKEKSERIVGGRDVIGYVTISNPVEYSKLHNKYIPTDRSNYLKDAGWSEITVDMKEGYLGYRADIYKALIQHMPPIDQTVLRSQYSLELGEMELAVSPDNFQGIEIFEPIVDREAMKAAIDAGFIPYDFVPHQNQVVFRVTNEKSKMNEDVFNAFFDLESEKAQEIIADAAVNKPDEMDILGALTNLGKIVNIDASWPLQKIKEKLETLKSGEFTEIHIHADSKVSSKKLDMVKELASEKTILIHVMLRQPLPQEQKYELNGTYEQHLNLLKFVLGQDFDKKN